MRRTLLGPGDTCGTCDSYGGCDGTDGGHDYGD
jgi:hypothetical protein